MAPKIKLEVTHSQHEKKSGGKLGNHPKDIEQLKNQKSQALSSIKQIPIAQNQQQKSQIKKSGDKQKNVKPKPQQKQQVNKQKPAKLKNDKQKSANNQKQLKDDKNKPSNPQAKEAKKDSNAKAPSLQSKEIKKDDKLKILNAQTKDIKKADKGKALDSQAKEAKKQAINYLQTIEKIKGSQQKTKITIQQLIEQYKDASDDIFINHGHNIQKQAKIQAHLNKLKKQKQAFQQKLATIKRKQDERHKSEQAKQKQKQENRVKRLKNKIKKRAQNKTIQIEKQRQQRLNKQAEFLRYYQEEYKKKKFRYQKYIEEEKDKKNEMNLDYRLKLKMIHNKYTPIDYKNIEDFNEELNEDKWKHLEQWQNKRQMDQRILDAQNSQLKKKIWKGRCHKSVEKQREQIEQEKQKAKTIQKKRKQYGTKIRYDYGPKGVRQSSLSNIISQINRSKQFQNRRLNGFDSPALSQGQGIKKKQLGYKYRKGANLGPIIELRHQALSHQEAHLKGVEYLEYLKNLPKAKKQVQTVKLLQENPEEKKKPDIVRIQRQANPYYVSLNKSKQLSINSRQSYTLSIAKVDQQKGYIDSQKQSIKYGSYSGILDLQRKKNLHVKNMVQNISAKLDILNNI